jgi:hypothetical protein
VKPLFTAKPLESRRYESGAAHRLGDFWHRLYGLTPPRELLHIVQQPEQLSQWEPEAQQDIAASQGLLLREE